MDIDPNLSPQSTRRAKLELFKKQKEEIKRLEAVRRSRTKGQPFVVPVPKKETLYTVSIFRGISSIYGADGVESTQPEPKKPLPRPVREKKPVSKPKTYRASPTKPRGMMITLSTRVNPPPVTEPAVSKVPAVVPQVRVSTRAKPLPANANPVNGPSPATEARAAVPPSSSTPKKEKHVHFSNMVASTPYESHQPVNFTGHMDASSILESTPPIHIPSTPRTIQLTPSPERDIITIRRRVMKASAEKMKRSSRTLRNELGIIALHSRLNNAVNVLSASGKKKKRQSVTLLEPIRPKEEDAAGCIRRSKRLEAEGKFEEAFQVLSEAAKKNIQPTEDILHAVRAITARMEKVNAEQADESPFVSRVQVAEDSFLKKREDDSDDVSNQSFMETSPKKQKQKPEWDTEPESNAPSSTAGRRRRKSYRLSIKGHARRATPQDMAVLRPAIKGHAQKATDEDVQAMEIQDVTMQWDSSEEEDAALAYETPILNRKARNVASQRGNNALQLLRHGLATLNIDDEPDKDWSEDEIQINSGGLVTVLSSVRAPANIRQEGVQGVVTAVKRSIRQQRKSRGAPISYNESRRRSSRKAVEEPDDEELSQVLGEHGYVYVPNKGVLGSAARIKHPC